MLALALLALGCATRAPGPPGAARGALRLSEISGEGDAQRRASLRLVLQGLDAEASGLEGRGVVLYERALGVDATNPFAYLALARHYAAGEDASLALQNLEQAEVLLRSEGDYDGRCEAHLLGLRGAALSASGREDEGRALLERASALAPAEWADGRLAAAELR
jgi:tetratricopeptide (TPR) repeat protein